ncbi:unnamed protein product [Nippostrongylus brasiliensis]|uniref:Ribonuclease X25 (inferred by orthology to a D. melanogaster protein) n=1 Tax=Nippostrongylus brasiliensis TaxID=27835 RepID=A0A0N4XYT1_NIPBR|nr:unnamed protein product [Nippostrongylus brasiliensis]
MLTRIFPAAVCRADDDSVPDSCEIPPGTPMWSIHGLWPNFKNGSYPQFCDGDPMKFDEDLIKPIEQRLLKMWTNLYPSKTARSFWKHEWEKHGTCAQSHGNLSSELLYFSVEALKGTKISPRVEPYHLEDIREALKQGLSRGKHVQLNCLTDKKTRQTMLGDVRMCLDKSFMPIDCPHGKQRQPSLYLLGHPPPLPSFKECPTSVIYLDDDTAGRSLKLFGLEHPRHNLQVPSLGEVCEEVSDAV